MPAVSTNKTSIGVTAFKSQCLGLIDDVAQGKTDRIVLLKHNRPIAAVVPIREDEEDVFDLWGAMGPSPDTNDPWYGFHRFKEGYAPQLVEFIGSFDLVIRPTLYRLYTSADSLRWAFLKLKTY